MGCQSSLTMSNSESNSNFSPIILFFLTIRLCWATNIDWGNGYPVNDQKALAIFAEFRYYPAYTVEQLVGRGHGRSGLLRICGLGPY